MAKIAHIIVILGITVTSYGYSSDYSSGYSKYIRGDFAGAEADFRKSAQTTSSTRKARALKMLGITHYMQGERTAAESSFRQAKRLDPNIRIAPSEVLDESVLSFFNGVKAPTTTSKRNKPKPTRTRSIVQTPERIPTYIRIISNVPSAKFSINGIHIGQVNKPFKTKPGQVQIEVTANGYRRYIGPHRIRPGSENAIRITLIPMTVVKKEKPKLKPRKPKPKVKPKPKAKPKENIVKREPKKRKYKKRTRTIIQRKVIVKEKPIHPIIHFVPLGINHFAQGQNTYGFSFALGQVGFLGYSLLRYMEGVSVTEDTDKVIEQRNSEFNRITDQEKREQHRQETDSFYAERLKYIDAVYSESNIAAGLFAVTWGVSAIVSYANEGSDSSQTKVWLQPKSNRQFAIHASWEF